MWVAHRQGRYDRRVYDELFRRSALVIHEEEEWSRQTDQIVRVEHLHVLVHHGRVRARSDLRGADPVVGTHRALRTGADAISPVHRMGSGVRTLTGSYASTYASMVVVTSGVIIVRFDTARRWPVSAVTPSRQPRAATHLTPCSRRRRAARRRAPSCPPGPGTTGPRAPARGARRRRLSARARSGPASCAPESCASAIIAQIGTSGAGTHRYMVIVNIWLWLNGRLVFHDAAPGRTVPCV